MKGKKKIGDMLRQEANISNLIMETSPVTAQINKQLFSQFIENTPAPIAMFDRDMKYIITSRRFLTDYNLKMRDIIGRSHYEVFPEIPERWKEVHRRCLAGATEKAEDDPFPRSDGRLDWVHWEIQPWYEANGEIGGIILFSEVITERKRAEAALKESEERFRELFNRMSSGVAIYRAVDNGLDFEFVDFNAAGEWIERVSKAEIIGKRVTEAFPGVEEFGLLDVFRRVWQTGIPEHYPISRYEDNRISGWRENFVYRLSSGEVVAVYNDVTEHKKAEEALKESEQRYRQLLEVAPVSIAVHSEGKLVFTNPAGARMIGANSPQELVGKPISEIVHPEGWEIAKDRIQRMFEGEQGLYPVEDKYIRLDGTAFPVEVVAAPFTYQDKPAVQVIVIDITERKQMEEERRENAQKLVKAMESTIEAMATTVEMRDPYTAGHQLRVAALVSAIAKEMDISADQVYGISMAGIVHDIGKIFIPAEILSRPGKLSKIEFDLIKMHPEVGYNILKDIEFPWSIAQAILQHHERMDGSGYPAGLSREAILLEARILAVADVVEAMASHRPYRAAIGLDGALEEISMNSGILYDADVVDACIRLFHEKGFKLE
ncbi:MAG: PAS domain S-box protein [Desulfobacteria bacterium]